MPSLDRSSATGSLHAAHKTRPEAVAVLPFSAEDDSAVTWAVHQFESDDREELKVVHPDPHGVGYPELAELRVRFASHLAGRYRVEAGHPDGPDARRESHPTLHFVRARSSR
jgi:hypothetical protein